MSGTFTPTAQAQTLSVASHFNNASTPVIARFSVGGGIPNIPDVDDIATPKGVAIRFQVDNNTYTDLISHSFNGFATSTGDDFLTFLRLFRSFKVKGDLLQKARDNGGDYSKELENSNKAQVAFGAFLSTHPSAAKFVSSPKPNPYDYGTITYYEPNTHVLTNKDGQITNVRYRLNPADGDQLYNSPEQLKKRGSSYLEDDLRQRFPQKPIVLNIQAQIANPDDILDNATIPYKSTKFVPIGKVEINKVVDDNDAKQQQIAFSPSPEKGGIVGIAPSKDPLIQSRKGVYSISADQRRKEKQVESSWS